MATLQGVVSKPFSSHSQITDFCDRGQPRAPTGRRNCPVQSVRAGSRLGPGLAARGDRVVGGPSASLAIWLAVETCLDTTPRPSSCPGSHSVAVVCPGWQLLCYNVAPAGILDDRRACFLDIFIDKYIEYLSKYRYSSLLLACLHLYMIEYIEYIQSLTNTFNKNQNIQYY
jgi:hypothetical protein